jgi:hypothetical protein
VNLDKRGCQEEVNRRNPLERVKMADDENYPQKKTHFIQFSEEKSDISPIELIVFLKF